MGNWLYGIAATALVLTLFSSLLPTGAIRKTAMMGFGFLFLLAVTMQVKGLVGQGKNLLDSYRLENELEMKKVQDSLLLGDEQYTREVMEEYVRLLTEKAQWALSGLQGASCQVTIQVDTDPESETFAVIRAIHCKTVIGQTAPSPPSGDSSGSLMAPIDAISKIIISIDGITIQRGEEPQRTEAPPEQDPLYAQWEKRIVEILSNLFAVSPELVIVHFEEAGN